MKVFKKILSMFLSTLIMASMICAGTVSAGAAEDEFTLSGKFVKGNNNYILLQFTVDGISKNEITNAYKNKDCEEVALSIGFFLNKTHVFYMFSFDKSGNVIKTGHDIAIPMASEFDKFVNDIKTKGSSDVFGVGSNGHGYSDKSFDNMYGYKDKFNGNTFTTNRASTIYTYSLDSYSLSDMNKENDIIKYMNCFDEAEIALTYHTTDGETVYLKEGKASFNSKSSSAGSSKKISSLSFSKISNQTYTGKNRKPAVTIKDGDKTLVKGTDYTLSYKNCKEIGTATVTIKGKGNYTGSKTLTYKIVPKKTTLKVTKSSDTKAKFTWTAVDGAEKYQIYYSTNGGKYKKLATVSGSKTSCTSTKLDFEKNDYKFKIRSYATNDDTKYYSSYSKAVAVK